MISVCVIDDDVLLLESLYLIIQEQGDMNCVSSLTGLPAFFAAHGYFNPVDVVLLDVKLKDELSISSIQKIRQTLPEAKIIMMTGFKEESLLESALRAGIDGFVFKEAGIDEILLAIRMVYEGDGFVGKKVGGFALRLLAYDQYAKVNSEQANLIKSRVNQAVLSGRDVMVIQLLLQGCSYKEIAEQTFMSKDGVRYYVRKLYKVVGVNSRHGLKKILEDKDIIDKK